MDLKVKQYFGQEAIDKAIEANKELKNYPIELRLANQEDYTGIEDVVLGVEQAGEFDPEVFTIAWFSEDADIDSLAMDLYKRVLEYFQKEVDFNDQKEKDRIEGDLLKLSEDGVTMFLLIFDSDFIKILGVETKEKKGIEYLAFEYGYSMADFLFSRLVEKGFLVGGEEHYLDVEYRLPVIVIPEILYKIFHPNIAGDKHIFLNQFTSREKKGDHKDHK